MAKRFEGKTAIVTGASRGIGLAVAERLVADAIEPKSFSRTLHAWLSQDVEDGTPIPASRRRRLRPGFVTSGLILHMTNGLTERRIGGKK